MMSQESVDIRRLHHRVLIAALIVLSQDLSSRGGAQAWTYNYSITPNRKWPMARQWCQEHFIDMVTIQSQEETDFINKLLPFNSKYYWIGIHKVDGAWTRVGTDELVPEDAQNWATEEPDSIAGQDCVEIYIKRNEDMGMWNNEKCTTKKGTVCYSASCTQDSCSAHAECVETVGNYTCQCHPGFHGPRCEEAIACKPLLDPEHGSHHCFHLYGSNRFNSSCRFHCELGFRLVGVPQLLCQTSGHWSHVVPQCQVEQCPVLNHTNSSGGRVNCSHPIAPYSYNSTCEVRCDEGYELSGNEHIRCDHTGQWTASVPACTVKKCTPIFSPVTGNMTCVDTLEPFSFGSWCDFTCQEGYYLSGNSTLTCLASGQWSKPTPTCAVVQCNSLEAPLHASMQCLDPLGEYSYDSICSLQCEEGFELIGTNKTKCSSQGNWSHALPVCQAKRCIPQNPPSHGSISCSDPNGSFSFGSRCTSTCDEGFLLNGTTSTDCTSVGTWSTDLPHCLANPCPPLHPPSHGSLSCSHPHGEFSFGSRCTSACEEGFLLNGTADTECTSLGTWNADNPLCTAKRCPALNPPSHGSLSCSHPHGEFRFASHCTSNCKEGFLLNGAADTDCTSVGTWSTDLPHCFARQCPPLHPPSHGSLSCSDPHGEFSFGSRCKSACEEGFLLNGTADTECTSLGTWSRGITHCQARPCPLLAEAPQHGQMNCSHPYSPFSYDSQCDFGCTEGFWLRGRPTVTCNNSGRWSQDLPTCELVQCEDIHALSPPLSVNCSHPLGNFSFGSKCLFTCKDRFSLNGTDVLLCSSTGFWSDSLPNCTDLPVRAAMFMNTGIGVASVLGPLVLIGLAVLILPRFMKRGTPIISHAPLWEERTNPAFEF
ncbi:P-selectin-like isoform X2 [Paralichthys olivaceus]|uniref:P-selectin-like isoform X2 n=1 Tax=Paralichthys olivaceus TaxID=8255 RepID=UPI00375091E6